MKVGFKGSKLYRHVFVMAFAPTKALNSAVVVSRILPTNAL